MAVQHGNRTRRRGSKQTFSEAQAAESASIPGSGATEAEIRQRAHEIYQDRGDAPGDPVRDWLQAENELRVRAGLRRPDRE